MSLFDSILSAGGGAVQELGSQLGLGSEQTASALSALVPALAAGVQQHAQTPGGLASLMAADELPSPALRRRPLGPSGLGRGRRWQRDPGTHSRQQRCQQTGREPGRRADWRRRGRAEKDAPDGRQARHGRTRATHRSAVIDEHSRTSVRRGAGSHGAAGRRRRRFVTRCRAVERRRHAGPAPRRETELRVVVPAPATA
jgi:hypothetical protein